MGGRRARTGRGRRQRETTAAHAGASTSSYSGNSSLDEFFSSRSSDASFASAGANTYSKDRQQKHRRAEEAADVGTIADATILGRRYTRSGAASGTSKSSSRRTMPRLLIILLGCVALSILTNRRTTKKASKQSKNKAGYNIYKDPFFG